MLTKRDSTAEVIILHFLFWWQLTTFKETKKTSDSILLYGTERGYKGVILNYEKFLFFSFENFINFNFNKKLPSIQISLYLETIPFIACFRDFENNILNEIS